MFHVVDRHSTEFWRTTADMLGKVSVPVAHADDRRTTPKQGHGRLQGVAPLRTYGRTSQGRSIPQILGESLQDRVSVSASLTVPKT